MKAPVLQVHMFRSLSAWALSYRLNWRKDAKKNNIALECRYTVYNCFHVVQKVVLKNDIIYMILLTINACHVTTRVLLLCRR